LIYIYNFLYIIISHLFKTIAINKNEKTFIKGKKLSLNILLHEILPFLLLQIIYCCYIS